MNVQAMHYDFKQKINKADSQQYRNLRAPEIDWYLNEAQILFIRGIMNPRSRYSLEVTPRSIDDINTILRRVSVVPSQAQHGLNRYIVTLKGQNAVTPEYMYFVSGEAVLSNECGDRIARLFERKHIDMFEKNEFYKSSYEWGQVNFVMEENEDNYNMVLFTDGDYVTAGSFSIDEVLIDYLKVPQLIWFGGYNVLRGTQPVGVTSQDCELPEQCHTDIVDLAVLLATGSMQLPDYQVKMNKIQLTNN